MPIKLDSYYIYSLSTFKTFTKEENKLYFGHDVELKNEIVHIPGVVKNNPQAKADLRKSLEESTTTQRSITIIEKNWEMDVKTLIPIFENEIIRYIIENHPDHIQTLAKNKKLIKGLVFMKINHKEILRSIIDNGVMINGAEYRLYTAGSGQMRENEITLVEKDILDGFKGYYSCGLTDDVINDNSGINMGKYLAYSALPLSSSKPIAIDINKVIIVRDLEIAVDKEVEYIDTETFESRIATLRELARPICQTDGAGMVLPSTLWEIENQLNVGYSISGFQIRGPWIKGAVFPFDFKAFALACGNSTVTDIYGNEHDVISEDIQIILTESQFKANGYYKHIGGWDEYKRHFIANGLSFSATQVSNRPKPESAVNYQFLQTLDREKATPDAIEALCRKSTDHLTKLRNDRGAVLKAFGAVEDNPNRTPLQTALMLYPPLLTDPTIKSRLDEKIRSIKTGYRQGDLLAEGGFNYGMPDLFAFCEYLFEGNANPMGIIPPDSVYCYDYRDSGIKEVDCLRSPHLAQEHRIRKLYQSSDCAKWFKHCGKNVITSIQDHLMILGLTGDYDGDTIFITPERSIIDMVIQSPTLYYNMGVAKKKDVNNDNLYETLVNSIEYNDPAQKSTIGCISNTLTKIWNADQLTGDKISMSKYLVIFNNYAIDAVKTQKLLTLPPDIRARYDNICGEKLPWFFQWVKGKVEDKLDDQNSSVMNMVAQCVDDVPETDYTYHVGMDELDYSMLQRRGKTGNVYAVKRDEQYREIYSALCKLGKRIQALIIRIQRMNSQRLDQGQEEIDSNALFDLRAAIYRKKLLDHCKDEVKLSNMLIDMYVNLPPVANMYKILWDCFGDVILENLCINLAMTDYTSQSRRMYNPEKFIPVLDEAEKQIEEQTAIIYQQDKIHVQGVKGEELRKIYFTLLVKAKQSANNKVTFSRNEKLLTFKKIALKSGLVKRVKSKKKGRTYEYIPTVEKGATLEALTKQGFIKRDKIKGIGETYSFPLYDFEQGGEELLTIEPDKRTSPYYAHLFEDKKMLICPICKTSFIKKKGANAQKLCSEKCRQASKKMSDEKRR